MKKNKWATYGVIAAVILCGIYAVTGNESSDPKEARKERIEKMFSPLNGEHIKLTELIKAGMNEPGSYEQIETTYADQDTIIIVSQKYSGKNEFGGRVQGVVEAKVDMSGNIISVIQEN